ncbi:MAG: DNA repair protein RadC [Desulfuromonadaceae bacterium]
MTTKQLLEELGATKTLRMRVMRPVYSREVIREDMPAYISTVRFTSPRQVFEMFKDLIYETKEHFLCLHLDGKNRIICLDRVSVGSLNQSVVHVREVYKSALLSSAAAIILIHQHPSGDPSPSTEDIIITKRLKESGELIGIPILDHIIIGEGQFVSFVEQGLL